MSSSNIAFWPVYRFLRRQVRWSGIHLLKNFHSLLWSTQSKALAQSMEQIFSGIFLLFLWWTNVGNLVFGSSDFAKSNLYIFKLLVHILLKPNMKDFEYYVAFIWNKLSCLVVWTYFHIAFLEIEMNTDIFQSCDHCWVFQIWWHIECNTLTTSCLKIWNSSAGVLSPPWTL